MPTFLCGCSIKTDHEGQYIAYCRRHDLAKDLTAEDVEAGRILRGHVKKDCLCRYCNHVRANMKELFPADRR